MPQAAAQGAKGLGDVIGGVATKAQSDAKAQQLRNQARQESQIGAIQEENLKRSGSAARASSVAASGASGIAQSDFEDARANFDQEVALQALRIRANTQTRINALNTEADNIKRAGNIALATSLIAPGTGIFDQLRQMKTNEVTGQSTGGGSSSSPNQRESLFLNGSKQKKTRRPTTSRPDGLSFNSRNPSGNFFS